MYYHIMTENYFTDTMVADGVVVETWSGNDANNFKLYIAGSEYHNMLLNYINEDGIRIFKNNQIAINI